MKKTWRVWLTVLTLVWLALLPLVVPSGAVTPEAQRAYGEETPLDDEYAFLFEE